MDKFFTKLKKLERRHLHELSMLCGAAAVLLLLAGFVASGAPSSVYAWIITVSPSYSPVLTGGFTTISWTAPTSDYCVVSGPPNISGGSDSCQSVGTPVGDPVCTGGGGGSLGPPVSCVQPVGPPYTTTCYAQVNGASGSVTAGPINGNTTYDVACSNVSGGIGSSQGSGGAFITVVPHPPVVVYTPSTFVSFTANPSTVAPGGTTNLHWQYIPGNNFYGCEIQGGQWGTTGYFWLPATDAGVNNNVGILNADTTYQINCFDSQNGWGAWHPLTVTVTGTTPPTTPPAGSCTDIPTAPTVPSDCVTPVPAPGTCIPTGGSFSATTNTCSCPAGQHLSGTACVPNSLCSNGLADSYAPSCTCPSGQYQPIGSSSCVALPVCANGLGQSFSPSCTCPAGQVQSGATCVLQGVIQSFTANPNRVLKGNTATVTWATAHMSLCSLSSLDSSGTHALSSALAASLTPVITSQTVFTLTCTDPSSASYTVSQTVNLVPVTVEQ